MTERSYVKALVGDGVPLLLAAAAALAGFGAFAVFLAATGDFLPHDVHYLGLTARQLCEVADCRVVDFMVHDRAAFGGALLGLAAMYGWLALFPLRDGQRWAWWIFVVSGITGFGSFLAYLGFGYLDTWHGIGSLLLVPLYWGGVVRTRGLVKRNVVEWPTRRQLGRLVLLAGALGTFAGGTAILAVGLTDVFVPEDLEFIGMASDELRAVNPRLVPLIAHDRAGFGGAVLTLGLVTAGSLACSRLDRSLWEAIAIAGGLSLTAAIGTHLFVDYTDIGHLLPALTATASLVVGLALAIPFRRVGQDP